MSLKFLLRSKTGRARGRGRAFVAAALVGGVLTVPLATAPARAADLLYVPWSSYLAGWTDEYIPSSSNDCVAGRSTCIKQTLKELSKVLSDTGQSCTHNAIFALAYLRMTQYYKYTRDIPGYYEDVPFANHQDAVFAKYFTDAYYNWKSGNLAAVPQAWKYAFNAAASKTLTANGDLLLGMNAHINRDLPFVVASVGLVAPDGSSRKPDFDKVEQWLYTATEPMLEEAAQRFDPTINDANDPAGLSYAALFQIVSAWRENAWRNAEALVSAPTPEDRALVAAKIESDANTIAQSIIATQSYTPPLTTTVSRDSYCSVHKGDTAPMAYEFGTPDPWAP